MVFEDQQPPRVLVVDDEPFVREAVELYFGTEGFKVFSASNGEEALRVLEKEEIDIAILDILMPVMDGLSLLREMNKHHPEVEVVMASGCGTIDSAIEAMRLGAYDYVKKPILDFDEDLLKVVKRALERRRLMDTNRRLALDLKEINRELKTTNAALKRHLAELEILYDVGRMLGELEGLPALLDLAGATMQQQLRIPRSVVLLRQRKQWEVHCTPSSPAGVITTLPAESFALTDEMSDPEGATCSTGSNPALVEIVDGLDASTAEFPVARLVPLRANGELFGALVAFYVGSPPDGEPHLRLLRLLGALLSAPLALLRERVSQ